MRQVFYNTILILAIIMLCIYSYLEYNKYYPSPTAIKQNPEQYMGKIVEYRSGDITEINEAEKTFTYTSGKDSIQVKYSQNFTPKPTIIGQTSILVKLGQNSLELIDIRNHDYNSYKYLISIIGIIIFIYYFFKEWKFNKFGFMPKIPEHGDKNA